MVQLEKAETTRRYLIVGLGNPGRAYKSNRHNIGFRVIDCFAERHRISVSRVEMKSLLGKGLVFSSRVMLAKPQTFMNKSGDAVGPLLKYYDVPLTSLMVIYDEIDLPLGAIRLREKGGSGGHNGMKSIISHVGVEFPRLRLGVGRPPGKMEAAAYVLRDFRSDETEAAEAMVKTAVAALDAFLRDGIEFAMNQFNGSPEVG